MSVRINVHIIAKYHSVLLFSIYIIFNYIIMCGCPLLIHAGAITLEKDWCIYVHETNTCLVERVFRD